MKALQILRSPQHSRTTRVSRLPRRRQVHPLSQINTKPRPTLPIHLNLTTKPHKPPLLHQSQHRPQNFHKLNSHYTWASTERFEIQDNIAKPFLVEEHRIFWRSSSLKVVSELRERICDLLTSLRSSRVVGPADGDDNVWGDSLPERPSGPIV